MSGESRNTRIDVQIKIKRLIEMMQRPQGVSIKEASEELECDKRSFYRLLEKLNALNVPYVSKSDPNEKTSAVRYYLIQKAIKDSQVFLSSSEKALLRMMIKSSDPLFTKYNLHAEASQKLLEKLNDGIIHDITDNEYKYASDEFTLDQKWEYGENFFSLSNALELKQSITFNTCGRSKIKYEEDFIAFEDKTFFQTYTIINKNGIFYALGKVLPYDYLGKDKKLPADIRCIKIQNMKDIKFYRQYPYHIADDYDFDYWYDFYFRNNDKAQYYHIEVDKQCLHTIMHASQYYPEVLYDWGGKTHLVYLTEKRQEFLQYIRTLGKAVKVVAPKDFAEEVQMDLQKTLALYSHPSIPECYCQKTEIKAPANSFDQHNWKTSSYVDLCMHWWRFDITHSNVCFHQKLNYSLYQFNEKGFTRVLDCQDINYKSITQYAENALNGEYKAIPKLVFFEEYIAYEIPFASSIDDKNAEALIKNFDSIINNWSEKEVTKLLSLSQNQEIVANKDTYIKNTPILLLTGINSIDKTWAKEISEKQTLFNIPCKAILFTGDGNPKGDMTITVYKY